MHISSLNLSMLIHMY